MNKIFFLIFFVLTYTCTIAQGFQPIGKYGKHISVGDIFKSDIGGIGNYYYYNFGSSTHDKKIIGILDAINQKVDYQKQNPSQIIINNSIIDNVSKNPEENNDCYDNYFNDGLLYLNKTNEYDKAIVFFNRLTELYKEQYPYEQYPDTVIQKEIAAYYLLGYAYYRNEEYEKAIESFKFQNMYNTSSAACYYIGMAYDCIGNIIEDRDSVQAKKNYDSAMYWYNYPITKNIENKFCYYQLGMSYYYEQNDKEAIECFKEAIAIDPSYVEAYIGLSNVYCSNQQWDSALEWLKKATTKDSIYANLYNFIGNIYNYEIHDSESAIYYYNKVVNLFNNHKQYIYHFEPNATMGTYPSPNYYRMGHAYFCKKDYDKAIEYYNREFELYPDSIYYYNMIGDAYYANMKYDKAVDSYHNAIKLVTDNCNCKDNMYLKLGSAYLQNKNFIEGFKCYEEVIMDFLNDITIEYDTQSINTNDTIISMTYNDTIYNINVNAIGIMNIRISFVSVLFKSIYDKILSSDNIIDYAAAIEYIEKIFSQLYPESVKATLHNICGYTFWLESHYEPRYRDYAINEFKKAAELGSEVAQQWLKDYAEK